MAKWRKKTNVPYILGGFGCIGVMATTIMAIQSTPKALELLEDAEKEKGEDLSKWETVKTAGPVYLPAVITGIATISCIAGAVILSERQQASLISAYGLLNESYMKYQRKVIENFGEETHTDILKAIAEETKPVNITADNYFGISNQGMAEDFSEPKLFYEEFSGRYFEAPLEQVLLAEYHVNRNMALGALILLNDFYEFLGLERTDYGGEVGWYINDDYFWIDFNHRKVVMDDGLECYIIESVFPPDMEWKEYYG